MPNARRLILWDVCAAVMILNLWHWASALKKLRQDYEAGVIKAIDWLKGLLDAAKDTVQAERETGERQ